MCRFAMYLGPPIRLSKLVTEPSNSIIHQSYDAKERAEPLNGDGFGVAWYVPELRVEPAVFKSISPAWNDANLLNLAPVTRSHCLLAHVRAASPGLAVTQFNCHPFVRRNYAFMHNGALAGFGKIRRTLREGLSDRAYDALVGTTDSEHIFALLSDRWDAAEGDPLARGAQAMRETIAALEQLRSQAGIERPSYLNLAVTDGERALVTRFVSPDSGPAHSLYHARGALVVEQGAGRVASTKTDEAVLIASEPLGDRSGWEAVPEGHMILVDADGTTDIQAI